MPILQRDALAALTQWTLRATAASAEGPFKIPIRLRTNDIDEWTAYDLAIVPSRHPHGMDASKTHYGATLFVEPETREGRILTERFLRDGIADSTVCLSIRLCATCVLQC